MHDLNGIEYFEIIPGNKKKFLCTLKPHKTKVKNSYKLQRRKESKSGIVEFACKLTKENLIGLIGKKSYTHIIYNKITKSIIIIKPDTKQQKEKISNKKSVININPTKLEQEFCEILNTFITSLFSLLKGKNNV